MVPHNRRVNVDSYLERLGLKRPLPADLETLRRVHVAHLRAFPFHNVTIQRGGVVDIAAEAIAERFLVQGGGGYCFEQNTLLAAALRDLGFTVTTLLGRVGSPERRSLNHMLLRVDIGGQAWIADVGFGGEGPLEPLPLQDGVRVSQGGIDFSLRYDGQHWTLTIHYSGASEDLYEFSNLPHTRGDVEMANYYTSTHPASAFRRTLTIQRVTAEERVILRPAVVTRYRDGIRSDEPIAPHQLRARARELFGIELGEGRLLFETLPS